MSYPWWMPAVRHAAKEQKESKLAGVILIVIGFFLAPVLIGVPIMLVGFYKLCK